MANPHGSFIWYELLTSDADAAQDFYGQLVGWHFGDSGQPGMDYRIIHAGFGDIGGVMPISADMAAGGARPIWLGYINVEDVDTAVAAIIEAGGSIHMPAMTVEGVGTMAMVSDGQGAPFYIIKPTPPADNPDAISNAFAATEPMIGHCAWNELSTSDPESAVAFYTGQFGWRQDGAMDMGPMGKYRFFWHCAGMIGAVMPKMPDMPVSAWLYYMRVPDIDAAVTTINAKGGTILHGPVEIPGGDFSLTATDPQGATFGLVGARQNQ